MNIFHCSNLKSVCEHTKKSQYCCDALCVLARHDAPPPVRSLAALQRKQRRLSARNVPIGYNLYLHKVSVRDWTMACQSLFTHSPAFGYYLRRLHGFSSVRTGMWTK